MLAPLAVASQKRLNVLGLKDSAKADKVNKGENYIGMLLTVSLKNR
jgi:hypothetical protein